NKNENVAHEDKDTENGSKITPTTSENINKEITKQNSKSEKNHEKEGWEDQDTENGIKITPIPLEDLDQETKKQDSKNDENHKDEGWLDWLRSDPLRYWWG
ncbi:MAG: hypothetical protein AB3P25_05490, partial [Candidatus Liberibacter psyllaurous]